jgi:hypothetical protein
MAWIGSPGLGRQTQNDYIHPFSWLLKSTRGGWLLFRVRLCSYRPGTCSHAYQVYHPAVLPRQTRANAMACNLTAHANDPQPRRDQVERPSLAKCEFPLTTNSVGYPTLLQIGPASCAPPSSSAFGYSLQQRFSPMYGCRCFLSSWA